MINFDIKSMIKARKGTVIYFPAIYERLNARKSYQKILTNVVKKLHKKVVDSVIPAYTSFNQQKDSDSWFIHVSEFGESLAQEAEEIFVSLLALESKRHTKQFIKTVKKTVAIDLSIVVKNEDLADYLKDKASINSKLIKSLKDDVIRDVQRLVYDAKINGISAKNLSIEIKNKFDVSLKRAKLIARDQLSKLNSDLNKIRQTQAGVSSYKWVTSADERVRSSHRSQNGKIYKHGQETTLSSGASPGQEVMCRCIARAIIEF